MNSKLLYALLIMLCFALITIPGCKSEDAISILGTWSITKTYDQPYAPLTGTITFSGSDESGTVVFQYSIGSTVNIHNGTFTVTDLSVNFSTSPDGVSFNNHWGTIVNNNSMNGNFLNQNGNSGTWVATR